MPTTDELKGLYMKGKGKRDMTPLLKTTARVVWSGEEKGSSYAWNFSFNDGEDWGDRSNSSDGRAFAVPSRSDG